MRFRKPTKRGPVWFIEPMFPGYLFARFDYQAFHRQIRGRPGVSGFVQFAERIALLPDALISEIKSRSGADKIVEVSRALEPGQEVEITQGPFQGLKRWSLESSLPENASRFSSNGWAAPSVPKRA